MPSGICKWLRPGSLWKRKHGKHLPKRSAVIVNQIRSVDRLRLQQKIGLLSRQSMERVDEAIRISLGLIEF
jgi:mRNA-degrading endonuclease toxin of MazEF toxin-antitoxin module